VSPPPPRPLPQIFPRAPPALRRARADLAGVDFQAVNVLQYADIREGIKTFSNWPTIPQLYVGGEFVGGCDIITSLHQSGELEDILAAVAVAEE